MASDKNRYSQLIEKIFEHRYKKKAQSFEFERIELEKAARDLDIVLPKNLGDVLYSFRSRTELPKSVRDKAADGKEWIIEGVAKSKYRFRQVSISRIVPREELVTIKVPDATPEIIEQRALGDEQALLAKVRYNRLVDLFLGVNAYSLQNHLRTTIGRGVQIEIDEIYVGIDRHGRQFVIPVQAKGGKDRQGVVQIQQDAAWCARAFPDLICRSVAVQFMAQRRIALLELTVQAESVKVIDEKHYQLVPFDQISAADLKSYRLYAPSI